MYRHWTEERNVVRWPWRIRWPALDGMDRATWLLAGGGIAAVFVGWG